MERGPQASQTVERGSGKIIMKTSDFYYDLPQELIAQTPVEPRNASRMMKINRQTGEVVHDHFYNLCNYLKKGDLLVLNDSKVLPARIYGEREDTGSFIEFLLVEQKENMVWEILCRPGKKAKIGTRFVFGGGKLKAEIIDVLEDGNRIARFECEENFFATLDEIGQMPLPPYIHNQSAPNDRYQTVYAQIEGSAAAPTAGFHFTDELFEKVKAMGVEVVDVTLHIGLGTFRPVKVNNILEHNMHSEYYMMSKEAADALNKAKAEGRRIIAVGTTSTRTIESVMDKYGEFKECHGDTKLFIYPGYKFKAVNALITNFHLPKSTLVMLVSALAGRDNVLNAYKHAVEEKYRFFSFGDAMFIYDGTK